MENSKTIYKSASNLAYRLRAVARINLSKEAQDIVRQNDQFLIGLLRLQLQEGKDGNNNPVTVFGRDFYADRTVFNKERHGYGLGKQTGWITNYMTGEFYREMKVVFEGKQFSFISGVPYFKEIIGRSGGVIMKLSKQNVQLFTKEILLPKLKQKLRNA